MHYFFIESEVLEADREIALNPEDINHAYRVLRLRKGSAVVVADGRGSAYYGIIASIGPQAVTVWLIGPAKTAEPSLQVTLLQSLIKGEKMDLVIRQVVELGAARFVPVVTERSIPRLTESREAARLERWRKIARSAAAQCRRAGLPRIEPVCGFTQALEMIPDQAALVPWEQEKRKSLGSILLKPRPEKGSLLLFIGPEGGFSRAEIDALTAAGASTVHLGPRILRTETAAVTAVAMVQSAWGDLGTVQELPAGEDS